MRIAYLVPVMILSLVCGSFFADGVSSIVVDIAWAQEHPEHPAGTEGSGTQEHPEHPATEEGSAAKEHLEHVVKEKKPLTIESVALYLEGYAAKHAVEQGGWMKLQDEEKEKTLELKLDKIHRERLAKTGEGTYFVCADFLTPEGKAYDLDFWVKETDKGLEVTETTIHKEEGVARYNWVEKDGIWSRKPLEN
jgi:hypothetical protein